jgi:hypothetical protein
LSIYGADEDYDNPFPERKDFLKYLKRPHSPTTKEERTSLADWFEAYQEPDEKDDSKDKEIREYVHVEVPCQQCKKFSHHTKNHDEAIVNSLKIATPERIPTSEFSIDPTLLEVPEYQPTQFAPTPTRRDHTRLQEELQRLDQQLANMPGGSKEEKQPAKTVEEQLAEWKAFANELKRENEAKDQQLLAQAMKIQQKKEKIPDAEEFSGKRSQLRTWLYQLDQKLEGNDIAFPTEQDKIKYCTMRLRGPVLAWAVARQSINKDVFPTYEDFKKQISKSWGDNDPTGTAERKLRELTQKGMECSHYYTLFVQYSSQLDMSSEAKIFQFTRGLSHEVQEKLVGRPDKPTEFEDFAQMCISLDGEIKRFKEQKTDKTAPRASGSRQQKYVKEQWNGRTVQRQNWNQPGFYRQDRIKESEKKVSNPRYLGSAPMDIDEINQLKKENKCFYCKKAGHHSKDCKKKAYDKKQKGSHNHKSNNSTQDKGKNREVQMFEKRTHEEMEDQKPTTQELEWIRKNRLQEGSCHLGFAPRTSDGRLRERFCDGHGVECSRIIPKQVEDKKQDKKRGAGRATKDQNLQESTGRAPVLQINQLERKPLAGKAGKRDGRALLQEIQEMASKESTWKEPGTSGRNINWGKDASTKHGRTKIRGISYSTNDLPHSYENPCTPNFCYKQGERDRHRGITGFTRKCEKMCSPWNCTRCGNGRHTSTGIDGMLWNKCLDHGLCVDCLSDDERPAFEERCHQQDQAIIRHCVNTGRICPTGRFHLDEIEERATRLPEGHHKTKLLRNIRVHRKIQEEDDEWDEPKPTARFLVQGMQFIDDAEECGACYEKTRTLVSWDGRVQACEECAKIWTEAMGIRQPWKELRVKAGSKN